MEILTITVMIIVCFILYELATMNPLRWHPPHLVNNTDTLYLEDQHWQQTVFISLPICQKSVYLWICLQFISIFLKLVILRFPVTFQSKTDKNAVINIKWVRLSKLKVKINYWIGRHVNVIFCLGQELKTVQTAVSEHFEIRSKNLRRW